MVMRKIKLNRGKLANLPQLELGEPAVATDDGSLHIGTEQGNVKLAKDADVQAVSQQLADTSSQLTAKADKAEVVTKAEKTYVDSRISEVASGAPKGTYSTLADLQAAFPSGDDNNYLVSSDGHIYTWNGTAWTDTGILYQATGIALRGVSSEKVARDAIAFEHMDAVVRSTNLFNRHDVTPGYSFSGTTGEMVANASFNASGFIPIEPNADYITNLVGRYVLYDVNRNFISSATNSSFTTPANAFYARFAVANASLSAAQVNRGTTLLPYEPFYRRFKAGTTSGLEVSPTAQEVSHDHIQPQAVSPVQTWFFRNPINRFNRHDVIADKALDTAGNYVDDTVFSSSRRHIYLKENTQYSNSHSIIVVFYDKNKQAISRLSVAVSTGTFTTPPGTVYGKFSVAKGAINDLMINEGSTVLPYADHIYELQSTPEYPVKIPEGGGGGGGEPTPDVPIMYSQTVTPAPGAETSIADITTKAKIQEIELATNGRNVELVINIRQEDGTLEPYQLMASDGSGYVPITSLNLMEHGTTEFLFSAYDVVTNTFKFSMKERLFPNGLTVGVKNNETYTATTTVRVVGGSYV